MEFTRQNPSARFVVPDKITVRQQLQYFSEARVPSRPVFERLWLGAVPLITEWHCDIMPDHETNLDELTNPDITNVLVWAGVKVKEHIDSLDLLEKN
jgi:hypothetical protein